MAAGRHMPQAKRQLQLQRRLQRKLPLQQMHHPRAALQASLTPPTYVPSCRRPSGHGAASVRAPLVVHVALVRGAVLEREGFGMARDEEEKEGGEEEEEEGW